MIVEICCGDYESLLAAKEGGARRVELCAGLAEGGLTPSSGMIRQAVAMGIPSVNVLVRPRKGDFCYDDRELALMCQEISIARDEGATGIVAGVLTPDGGIDTTATARLMKAGEGMQFTFHRAFDVCADPFDALQTLIGMGCDTLLTSGQDASAPAGKELIRRLVDEAADRIMVMAGSGVNAANVAELVEATGVRAVHSTARRPVASRMVFRREAVKMGAPGEDEYQRLTTSPQEVRLIMERFANCRTN